MTSAPSSLESAFRHAAHGGGIVGVDPDPEQLDMLRDPATGKLPENVFRLMREGKAAKVRGRPRGAGNKRNLKLAKLICQEHGDPVMFMASVYSMPLDQMVELLRIADNSAEREAQLQRLIDSVDQGLTQMTHLALDPKQTRRVEQLLDKLMDVAKVLQFKPGELAIRALATQVQAAREVGPYVHGKQPIAVDVTGKVDGVLIIPGLNAPAGVDHGELRKAIDQGGLDRLNFEDMTLLPSVPVEEAEFEPTDPDDDDGKPR